MIRQRGVVLASLFVTLLVICAATASAQGRGSRDLTATNYQFSPQSLSVAAGGLIRLRLHNQSPVGQQHSLVVDLGRASAARLPAIDGGTDGVLAFRAPSVPGVYEFYCEVPTHRRLGMRGSLIVTRRTPSQSIHVQASNFRFEPSVITATARSAISVTLESAQGLQDIVFDLGGGRQVASAEVAMGRTTQVGFTAPAIPGDYAFYSTVSGNRARGMEGRLHIEPVRSLPPTAAPPNSIIEPIVVGLAQPAGLLLDHGMSYIALDGSGQESPELGSVGRGDAGVIALPIDPLGEPPAVLVSGLTNGLTHEGVVGVRSALPWPQDDAASLTDRPLLVALGGSDGQLHPDEAAKILIVKPPTQTLEVLADPLAHEVEHNPDGQDPEDGGLASDPRRLVPHPSGEWIAVVDGGAHTILKLDPARGALTTWAVIPPPSGSDEPAVPTDMAFFPDPQSDRALVSSRGVTGLRDGRLIYIHDRNDDGDAMDDGEMEAALDALDAPSAITLDPHNAHRLLIAEAGSGRLVIADVSNAPRVTIASKIDAAASVTGMQFAPSGDLLVTANLLSDATHGNGMKIPDGVGKIPAIALPTVAPMPTQPPPGADGFLKNISTRSLVDTGDKVMIGGFIVDDGPAKVVIRALGPSMPSAQVPNKLVDPRVRLIRMRDGAEIAANDNWVDSAQQAAIAADPLKPADPRESMLITTLEKGAYTAIVDGAGGATGIGLVEVFQSGGEGALKNLSTRGGVRLGDEVMIGGFIVRDGPVEVVIRARGPSLPAAIVPNRLMNPTVQLYRDQTLLLENDDWGQAPNAGQIATDPLKPVEASESVILTTLGAGAYTAIVRGAGGATGIGLVEVFRRGPATESGLPAPFDDLGLAYRRPWRPAVIAPHF